MNQFLSELYAHQAWADAEHWTAIEIHPTALHDDEIRKRLYHICEAQRAFLCIARKEKLVVPSWENFPDKESLKQFVKKNHQEALSYLKSITEEQLSEEIVIPWFKEPPIKITIEQALLQAAMHSHYHRGQNAKRLRELGGEPPLTDYLIWIWKGKPEPIWN